MSYFGLLLRRKPHRLKEKQIDQSFVEQCQSAAQNGEAWIRSAATVALIYLDRNVGEHNTCLSTKISVTAGDFSRTKASITIYRNGICDDSLYQTYDIIRVHWREDFWYPVEHSWAHKGRGHWGWTNQRLI